jgi:hypothetical protein
MRNLTCIFLGVLFIFYVIGCDNPTESDEDSLIGKWYLFKEYLEYYYADEMDEPETEEWEYDPNIDFYYNADIMEITKKYVIFHWNDTGVGYNQENVGYELLSNSRIFIEEEIGEEEPVEYSFEDDMLVFSVTYDEGGDDYSIIVMYFKKYTGEIPPTSWTTALQNDNYEPDNTYQNASSIVVGSDAQRHVILLGDKDWYKFQATSYNTYIVKITSYMDNVLTLFDKDGQSEIAEDDDNDYDIDVPGNIESVLVWDCESSGTYYFKVTGYDEDDDEGYYIVDVNLTNIESPLSKLVKKPVTNKNYRRHLFQETKR